jgi:Zn-dependent protease
MLGAILRPVPWGRLFGIPVLVSPAALLLLALPIALAARSSGAAGAGWAAALVGALCVGLLAHELAHALVARRLGLEVLDVTIWPLGGMARLAGLKERPQAEAPVAAAGPLANLVLAGVAWPLPGEFAHGFAVVNLLLGAGNLVPLFPLDGGRILRAFLARRSSFVDATRAALPPLVLIALATALLCWLTGQILLPVLLAIYLTGAGWNELVRAILAHGPPTTTRAEVWRRALQRAGYAPAAEPVREPPAPPPPPRAPAADAPELDAEPVASDLERFRGSLDEFFRHKR